VRAIEDLLTGYERGTIDRRHFVQSLSALVLSPMAAAGQSATTAVAVGSLNHVSISVADVDRSVDFYQKLFGMRVISREGTVGNPTAGGGNAGLVVNLAPGAGPEFVGIYKAEPAGHIGHFCLGVPNFNADQALKALQERGVKARMRTRGESKEIFLTDPDNVLVQLTDVSYCGGSGVRGNVCKA
jgi:glyoxylase I family protein